MDNHTGLKLLMKLCLFQVIFIHDVYCENFRFINYEVENGLPSNTVRTITQDHQGFMWFGTENGLSRFDGYTFKTFYRNKEDSTAIGNHYIYSLFEDSDSIFWVGTDEGVYIYYPQSETFSFFDYLTENGISIRSNISSIVEDKKGYIWFSTLGQGIFRFDKEKQKLYQYVSEDDNQSLGANKVNCLFLDSQDNLWAGTSAERGQVLSRYAKSSDNFFPFTIHLPGAVLDLTDVSVYAIQEDKDGYLWLGTWSYGLCKIDKKNGSIKNTFLNPDNGGIIHIHSLVKYNDSLWLAGSDDGLTAFNPYTLESTTYMDSEFKNNSLSNRFIYPIYKDREEGLWIGTYHGGVNYAAPIKGDIEGYTHSKFQNSVGGNIISCFCEDNQGNIWVGSDDGGLSMYDVKKKTFVNYPSGSGKNSLSYHNVHALYYEENKLWIGTYSGGLNILDLNTGQFKLYMDDPADEYSIAGNSIYSIYKDWDNNLWIGTMAGINLYNPEKDNFYFALNVGTTTIDILQDDTDHIWFATRGKGLYLYNKPADTWKNYLHNPREPESLPCNHINCLYIDQSNRLWMGSDEGLILYNREEDSFTKINLEIPGSIIQNILETNNDLWITTNNGLVQYNHDQAKIRLFTKKDGLQSDLFNLKAGLLTSRGELFLGTVNGFNIITPQEITENSYIPPINFTQLLINNEDMSVYGEGAVRKAINFTSTINLTHKENVFTLEYAALSYVNPSNNQYRYILQGFDRSWNYVGSQRRATYTNLPAGKYIFRVTGSNNDGIWNQQEQVLTIIIHPPFWFSPLAYFIYTVLVLVIIGYLINAWRVKTEKKHKERLQQLREDSEKELHEAKINFFTMIAHEIRTPVSLIIGPLEKIMEKPEQFTPPVKKELQIINRNGQRLLNLVNQLLDFRKAEKKAFTMSFFSCSISTILENIYDRFYPLASQKGIQLILKMETDIQADIDEEAFTKIVSNLLTNAIKHTKNEIIISCHVEEEKLIIKVKDNGSGISYEEQQKIFQPFYQSSETNKPGTGLGLSLVQLLTEAHNGKIWVESIPEEYAEFIIQFPIHQIVQPDIKTKGKKNFILTEEKIITPEIDGEINIKSEESDKISDSASSVIKSNPVMLIIEDNREMLNFLENHFQEKYKVLTALHGEAGLKLLKTNTVDIIISDVMMPVMDGVTFCKTVKTDIQFSHIPLVLLTAKTDITSKLDGIQSGADLYIEKPFSPKILQASLDNLLKSRELLRKKFSEMPFVPMDTVAGNKADEDFIARLTDLINQNISNESFSIEIMAKELHISRSGLFTKLKSLVDMTPNELIQIVRLKKAAELLSSGQYRINEICYQVGFSNPSYFAKCFQKQFGLLPKDFIKKQPV